uniref:Histone acetyltransferase n=1 Tax=Panagrolaimus sp. ES5 TaxID=591445 RepID=A0AC34G7I9_9BILA
MNFKAKDDRLKTPAQLPYFEGDLWPQTIEDCIKNAEKKNNGGNGGGGSSSSKKSNSQDNNDSDEMMEENGSYSHNKKGSTTMKKSGSSKKLKNNSYAMDDAMDKLFVELDKHKDMFFTIKLASTPEWTNMIIKDPDPLISSREEHWEFSSLRRAKYSTLCLCHALHVENSNIDNSCTCNYCSQPASWHCDICDDFDLCNKCHEIKHHEHKLTKVQSLIDVNNSDSTAKREESVRRCVQVLVHASLCRDINCRRPKCQRLKQILQHFRGCKKKSQCSICKQLTALCCFHAKKCNDRNCKVPFCEPIRAKLDEQRHLQNRRAEMLMRRRMNVVQNDDSPPAASQHPSQHADT